MDASFSSRELGADAYPEEDTSQLASPARRNFALGAGGLALLGGAATLAPAGANAQSKFPARAVRLVVPSAAGGGTDIVGRLMADKFSGSLGQQVFVDNRPGAGQMIGIDMVAKSAPDGYTILMAASTLALNPVMFKKVPYDTVHDFAPISEVASLPNILVVHPSLPVKTVAELIALAKKEPGKLSFASAGIGTSPHMSMELFKDMAKVDIVHVPYKGTTPAVTDVLAGQVPIMMANTLTVLGHIKSGKLRALGMTGLRRIDALPDVPTISEAGVPGYESVQWYGLLAPAGTPDAIIQLYYKEVVKALNIPEIKQHLNGDGADPVGNTPKEFAALIKSEMEKWARVAKSAGIQPE